jgi:uncharacterized protein
LKKALYVFTGVVSLLLAYIGIIIPGFPAIPFIVLSAYLFTNSSPRLLEWMMRRPLIRKLFNKSKKVDRRIFKGLLISQVWFSVAVAELTLAHTITARILWGIAGLVLTVLVLIFMKIHRHPENIQIKESNPDLNQQIKSL